jgi:transposase
MSGIRFTDEFKRDAVAQVLDRGYSVAEVSERLGISRGGPAFQTSLQPC